MSYVNILIAKDDNLYLVSLPFRKAQNFLENGESMLPLLNPLFLDAGYIVLDFNRKALLNCQSAFPIGKPLREEFDVLEG